jgi:hypothetical protein
VSGVGVVVGEIGGHWRCFNFNWINLTWVTPRITIEFVPRPIMPRIRPMPGGGDDPPIAKLVAFVATVVGACKVKTFGALNALCHIEGGLAADLVGDEVEVGHHLILAINKLVLS